MMRSGIIYTSLISSLLLIACVSRGVDSRSQQSTSEVSDDPQYLPLVLQGAPGRSVCRPSPGTSWQIQFAGDLDTSLNEQCFQYNECDLLLPLVQAGKPMFGIEYQSDPAEFCPLANAMNFDFLKKRLELDAWRIAYR